MSYVYKVAPGETVRLRDLDPGDTRGVDGDEAERRIATLNERLAALQEIQYAAGHNAILIVLQGLDTAGKDGTIKHVMAQFNPTGCKVEPFKVPTADELAHDFLWRVHRVTPPRGIISIFNRSYYEDVLVVRVHKLAPKSVWERRYAHINNFESLLTDSGTIVLKFFLYISKNEQRDRLLAREQEKEKAWKLSPSDWPEHKLYADYVKAYEEALSRCSTKEAPWYIVPANRKWFRNLAVAQAIVDAMEPYEKPWHDELVERGRQSLALINAQHQHGASSQAATDT